MIEPSPEPVQQESHSPIYATIQRNRSIDRSSFATVAVNSPTVQMAPSNETPKPSTFKRIQSFFRATPSRFFNSLKQHQKSISALTNSTKTNRVIQVKSTVVAFGSSTPTNRLPPGPTALPTPSASIAQKISTPKSKYNLRTRLFNNPISKDDDEVRTKDPIIQIYSFISRKNLKQKSRYEHANKFIFLYMYCTLLLNKLYLYIVQKINIVSISFSHATYRHFVLPK
jgi:hypothetical protein